MAGTALFLVNLPDRGRVIPHESRVGGLGPLRSPGIRAVALSTIPFGFMIGTVEVALPAFSEIEGSAALAGVLLALWSLASGVGGLVFGARQPRRELLDTYLGVTLLFPFLCLPLILASSPVAMGILVLAAGAPIAPLIATRNQLISIVAPAGTGTEAFSWLMTSLIAGISLGTAVAGERHRARRLGGSRRGRRRRRTRGLDRVIRLARRPQARTGHRIGGTWCLAPLGAWT